MEINLSFLPNVLNNLRVLTQILQKKSEIEINSGEEKQAYSAKRPSLFASHFVLVA